MSNTGYINIPRSLQSVKPARKMKTQMKLTLKQRFRNWLHNDNDEAQYAVRDVEIDTIQSNGMRFQLYIASGGYVVETRNYDERSDRHSNKLYVITDDKDLGAELGKIITMESLR